MNIWEFVMPFAGDVRLPVTLVFLATVAVWMLIATRGHIPKTLLVVSFCAYTMQWLPGFTMFIATGCMGINMFWFLAKHSSDPLELPSETELAIEYLPDGRMVGHKWLVDKGGKLYSPVRPFEWVDGQLTSFNTPLEDNTDGIYVYYRLKDAHESDYHEMSNVLVTVACDGEVVYHQVGARVEHAEIIDIVKRTGRW